MAYYITDACAKCGAPKLVCTYTSADGEEGYPEKYVIDADQCVDCGTCASVCPVEAIEQQ